VEFINMALEIEKLKTFLEKASNSQNPYLQEQAVGTSHQMLQSQEDDEVIDADIQAKNTPEQKQKQPEIEDLLMQSAMKEMEQPDQADKSTFGKGIHVKKQSSVWDKLASAYIKDVTIKDLPNETKDDIKRFVKPGKEIRVIEYGMVVSELLPKVDKHNFEQAEKHIKESIGNKDRKERLKEFFAKADNKYILILNDKIIDGHHFLAKAKDLNITSSLKVIDLTPVRFQEKSASLFNKLVNRYAAANNSR
jgi:hypothetical protein